MFHGVLDDYQFLYRGEQSKITSTAYYKEVLNEIFLFVLDFSFSVSTELEEKPAAQSGWQGKVALPLPPGSLTSARSDGLAQCRRNRASFLLW